MRSGSRPDCAHLRIIDLHTVHVGRTQKSIENSGFIGVSLSVVNLIWKTGIKSEIRLS